MSYSVKKFSVNPSAEDGPSTLPYGLSYETASGILPNRLQLNYQYTTIGSGSMQGIVFDQDDIHVHIASTNPALGIRKRRISDLAVIDQLLPTSIGGQQTIFMQDINNKNVFFLGGTANNRLYMGTFSPYSLGTVFTNAPNSVRKAFIDPINGNLWLSTNYFSLYTEYSISGSTLTATGRTLGTTNVGVPAYKDGRYYIVYGDQIRVVNATTLALEASLAFGRLPGGTRGHDPRQNSSPVLKDAFFNEAKDRLYLYNRALDGSIEEYTVSGTTVNPLGLVTFTYIDKAVLLGGVYYGFAQVTTVGLGPSDKWFGAMSDSANFQIRPFQTQRATWEWDITEDMIIRGISIPGHLAEQQSYANLRDYFPETTSVFDAEYDFNKIKFYYSVNDGTEVSFRNGMPLAISLVNGDNIKIYADYMTQRVAPTPPAWIGDPSVSDSGPQVWYEVDDEVARVEEDVLPRGVIKATDVEDLGRPVAQANPGPGTRKKKGIIYITDFDVE